MIDRSVNIAGMTWKSPVTNASGTFGSGTEYGDFFDPSIMGAVTTKGIAPVPWEGNAPIRIAETPSGMLNAIGLMGPGVERFIADDLPHLTKVRETGTHVIVNVCGHAEEEYITVVRRLEEEAVDAYEINISCPNVAEGGIAFGTDPARIEAITARIRKETKRPLIMKLSPNVTSIADCAKAAECGGADALSLINTITGMKIDVEKKAFVLQNKTGGLSGPAIHPVAVRMVYEASGAVGIPVIGMGGIRTWEDAVELLLAGASAVAVGTALFRDPHVMMGILNGIDAYLERHNIAQVRDLTGMVRSSGS